MFEVLLALSILTLGMATVGIQVSTGLRLETEAAEIFRRQSLIESMLAQLEVLVADEMSMAEEESGPALNWISRASSVWCFRVMPTGS